MKDTEYKYFRALSDVLLNSIKRKDYTIIETLLRFFYGAFKKIRDDSINKPVVYPSVYYEVVYRIIEELASQASLTSPPIQHRTAGSVWLLGEGGGSEISAETLNWIWRNLSVAIRYDKDEFIMDHWQTAHQYVTYSLRYIQPEYNTASGVLVAKNQDQIDHQISLRKRFIEFHYALGGLLLYKQRYKLIKRMFDYTTSIPPKYELLPESMHEIFSAYNEFRDPYDRKYPFIEHLFPFPDLSGLNAGPVIQKWISSYMALLFLRQYTIHPYLITMQPLAPPAIPKTQSEIKKWIESLPFFKTLVTQHLENKVLMEVTGLSFLTREWCSTKNVPYPLDFLDTIKTHLETAYETNARNLPMSEERKQRFVDAAKNIVEPAIEDYNRIKNSSRLSEPLDTWYVNGQRMIQGKDAFSESPEADHLNFDTILPGYASEVIREGVASTFLFKATKSFVLKPEDIFKAVDILGADSDWVIIGFGFDIDRYVKELRVWPLTFGQYKQIPIALFDGTRVVEPSLFVLKKAHLPGIETLPLEDSTVKNYALNKISEKINLYASVIDLSKASDEILKEFTDEKSEEELKKSALLTIGFSLKLSWKKEMEMIELMEYSEYRQSGLPASLSEVKQYAKAKE